MATFKFETKVSISIPWDSVDAQGEIELNDDEIDTLICLMRKNRGVMDYRKLNLAEVDPQLYEKIDNAYHEVAYETEGHYIINYERDYEHMGFDYDVVKLLLYCRDNCGFDKSSDGDIITNHDVNEFNGWLIDYVDDLKFDDALEFLEEHTFFEVNFEDDDIIGSDYTCDLPKKLLKIEKGWKSKK